MDNTILRRAKSLKYCNMWSMIEEFMDIVDELWQQNVSGTPMYQVVVKLKKLKQGLKMLNKAKSSNIENETMMALTKLIKENNQGIEEAFVQYYESLLGIDDSSCCRVSDSIVKEGPILTSEQQQHLCVPFTEADVKVAIFDVDDTKAAGPDGYIYTSNFFKKAWGRIGTDVCQAVLNFF
ncbi:uncharacterized protein LOC130591163 [Beta vulgaris subsp. vulgaris]|uniref:uncharacterized protein LOC130591163 n=1 Tax=Beta vulgaris subsp. vulgaris TaxID=3555 RepID=UPI0025481BB8|nr:uncharacterized protein LOC130591163 [Beta vulgaris subsp. vulgaris]